MRALKCALFISLQKTFLFTMCITVPKYARVKFNKKFYRTIGLIIFPVQQQKASMPKK